MRKQRFVMAATAGGLLALFMAVQPASAFHAPYATQAPTYRAWLVRAMDECDPATISVFGLGFPDAGVGGCLQTNVVTDEIPLTDPLGATMTWGRLMVTRTSGPAGPKVRFLGRGFQPGQRVAVQLTLRTTRNASSVKHLPGPGTNKSVTFEDTMVQCGNNNVPLSAKCVSHYFVARPNGVVVGSQTLAACLTSNSLATGFGLGNIEIVDAGLVNCDTGKVIGRPGVLDQ